MYEPYCDVLPPIIAQENIRLRYMVTNSFLSSVKTNDITKKLKNPIDLVHFSNLEEDHTF